MYSTASRIRIRLQTFNCDGRYGTALLAVCGLVLALQLADGAASHLLRYDRPAIAAGQWWRLLTAHLVHLSWRHAVLDLAGLVLLWVLFARDLDVWAWAGVTLTAAAAIDCGLWVRDPQVIWYLGLSGVLHGVLAAVAFVRLRRGELEGWILAGLLVAKLAYEQIHGAMPFAGDMPVIVDAHLYGALGGLCAAMALGLRPSGSGRTAGHSPGRPEPLRPAGRRPPRSR